MPATENPLITVLGEAGVVMTVVAGLVDSAVQMPAPVAAIAAVEYWQVIWSAPAFGLAVTITLAVSEHPVSVQI